MKNTDVSGMIKLPGHGDPKLPLLELLKTLLTPSFYCQLFPPKKVCTRCQPSHWQWGAGEAGLGQPACDIGDLCTGWFGVQPLQRGCNAISNPRDWSSFVKEGPTEAECSWLVTSIQIQSESHIRHSPKCPAGNLLLWAAFSG